MVGSVGGVAAVRAVGAVGAVRAVRAVGAVWAVGAVGAVGAVRAEGVWAHIQSKRPGNTSKTRATRVGGGVAGAHWKPLKNSKTLARAARVVGSVGGGVGAVGVG